MKIAVLDDYADIFRTVPSYNRLEGHQVDVFRQIETDLAKQAVRLKDCEVLVLTQERSLVNRMLLEKLPKLRFIVQTGGHESHIDVAACTEHGIAIATGGQNRSSRATAELTWALILASVRRIPQEVQGMKLGRWQTTAGTELCGLTLGIYGLGRIGAWVAEVGKAFGMKVICWGREGTQTRARVAGYELATQREAFFASVDVLSLHLRFNYETRGIVTAADLAAMKSTALLVNTARAGLIEEGALTDALRKGRPGYAAVDVYEREPVTAGDHPLLSMTNAICTPHLGYATLGTFEFYYDAAIGNILAYVSGKPANLINPDALLKARLLHPHP